MTRSAVGRRRSTLALASVNMCNDGLAGRRDSSGARTSNPIEASIGPVLAHELPRLVLAQRHLAAPRCVGAAQRREASAAGAPSRFVTVRPPSERSGGGDRHELAGAGAGVHVETATHPAVRAPRVAPPGLMASVGHRRRPLIDPPRRLLDQIAVGTEARSVHPRARSCRPGRCGFAACGGCAGRSIRSTLSRHDRFDDLVEDRRTVARPGWSRRAPTPSPAWRWRRRRSSPASVAAGTHRTCPSTDRPLARDATSSRGTIEPPAARRTPSRATRPSHARLAPIPFRSRSALIATSQPKRVPHRDRQGLALARRRAGMPAWSSQPWAGPPHCSKPVGQLVVRLGRRPAPAAPHDDPARRPRGLQHHLRRSATPARTLDSASDSARRRGAAGRSSSAVARSALIVSTKSPTTWSRSSASRADTDASPSSTSSIRRFSSDSDASTSTRSSARSSSVPRPSTIDQIDASSCLTSTMDLRPQTTTDARLPRAANAPVAAPGSRAVGSLDQWVRHVTESHHGPTGVVPTAAA